MKSLLRKTRIITALLVVVFMFSACESTNDTVAKHIGEPLAMSGDLTEYVGMGLDSRKATCDEKHVEISGIVSSEGTTLIYIGQKNEDGLEIHCTMKDSAKDLRKGDYVTINGVCSGCYSDTMYMYGCSIISHISKADYEASLLVGINQENLAVGGEGALGDILVNEEALQQMGAKADEIIELNVLEEPIEIGTIATSESIAKQTATEKPESTATPQATTTSVATKTSESASVKDPKTPAYTVSDLVATMYASSVVNIRKEPDTNATKLGSLKENQEVNVTGKTDNGWYRIDNGGGFAFVKSEYLLNDKKNTEATIEKANVNSDVVATTVGTVAEASNLSIAENKSSSGQSINSSKASEGLCWLSATGSCYHSINNCGKMNPNKARQVTIEEAKRNYTKCPKCW